MGVRAGQRVLFFPDQHLGRNTAKPMGVPLEQMPLWNPRKALGGNTAMSCTSQGDPVARLLLGAPRFTVDQIAQARAHPGVQAIVHPECPMAVVDAADSAGPRTSS